MCISEHHHKVNSSVPLASYKGTPSSAPSKSIDIWAPRAKVLLRTGAVEGAERQHLSHCVIRFSSSFSSDAKLSPNYLKLKITFHFVVGLETRKIKEVRGEVYTVADKHL